MKNMFLKLFAWSSFLTLLLGGLLLVLPSCMDEKDFKFDKISGVEWTGSYALPLINSSMTIKDLIGEKDSGQIKEESDGLIYLEYDEDIISTNISEQFKVPNRTITKQYPIPDVPFPSLNNSLIIPSAQVASVDLPAFPNIISLNVSQGSLNISVKNNGGVVVTLTLQIINTGDNTPAGVMGTFTGAVGAGATVTQSTPLTGKTLKKQLSVKITAIAPAGANITVTTAAINSPKASGGEIILQNDLSINSQAEIFDFGTGANALDPEQIKEVLFKSGNLSYTINSSINYPMDVAVSMPDVKKNGTAFSQAIAFTTAGVKTGSVLLDGYLADFTQIPPTPYNKMKLEVVPIAKASSIPFKWTSTDKVTIDITLGDMVFKYIKGFFGTQTIPIDDDEFAISAFENSLDGIKFSFKDPTIKFTVTNDYGVPIRVNFTKLSAMKDGVSKNISTNPSSPIDINFPAVMGDKAGVTPVSVTNVNEIYNLSPSKVAYKIDGILNNGLSSGNNFMTDTSKVTVNMYAKIPLYGKASGLALNDTVDNSLKDEIEDIDVEFIKLKAVIKNQFPIDAQVQIYLANDNYQIQDSLFTPAQTAIVTSSTVDGNGELVKEGVYDQIIEVNKAKFEKLIESPYLIIKAKMATAEAGQKDVKIKSIYKLDVKLGVQTKLNIKVKVQ